MAPGIAARGQVTLSGTGGSLSHTISNWSNGDSTSENGEIVISGGTVSATSATDIAIGSGYKNGKITVTGGTVNGMISNGHNASGVNITVSGGTTGSIETNESNTKIKVTGGTVNGGIYTKRVTWASTVDDITGVEVTVGTSGNSSTTTPEIKDGIYSEYYRHNTDIRVYSGKVHKRVYTQTGDVTISGGSIVLDDNTINIPIAAMNGNMTITNGTITSTVTAGYSTIDVHGGNCNISGGNLTLKAESEGIYCSNAPLNISGGTINITSDSNVNSAAIFVHNSNCTISGGNITSTTSGTPGIKLQSVDGSYNITVTGGTIKNTGGECIDAITNGGTLTIGNNSNAVSTTSPSITGSTRGVSIDNAGTFNFYDGIIRGATAIFGTVTNTPSGYSVVKSTSNSVESATLAKSFYTSGGTTVLDAINNNSGSHSTSTTTWKALTGANGTISNGTWGGNYLQFNGSSTQVMLGAMNSNYQSMEATFAASAKTSSANRYLVANLEGAGGGIYLTTAGKIVGMYHIDGAYRSCTSTTTIVALTYDGTNVKLYVNGVLEATTAYTGTIKSTTTQMALGGNPAGNAVTGERFTGKIYSAAVYNKALTAAQVKQNAEAGRNRASLDSTVTLSAVSSGAKGLSMMSMSPKSLSMNMNNDTNQVDEPKSDESETGDVAEIGKTKYTSLQEAINAAESGDEITLLENVELDEELVIDEDKVLRLDLNGKTITGSAENTISNSGNLTIVGKGNIENTAEQGNAIDNSGKLRLEKVTINVDNNEGKGINNSSELEITGGSIQITSLGSVGIYNSGNGTVHIIKAKEDDIKEDLKIELKAKEGTVISQNTLPSYGIVNASNKDVTVEAGTINVEMKYAVGIANNEHGAIVLGKDDDIVDVDNPVINATVDHTIAIQNSENGKVYFLDGKVLSTSSIKPIITDVLVDYELIEEKNEENVFVAWLRQWLEDIEAAFVKKEGDKEVIPPEEDEVSDDKDKNDIKARIEDKGGKDEDSGNSKESDTEGKTTLEEEVDKVMSNDKQEVESTETSEETTGEDNPAF